MPLTAKQVIKREDFNCYCLRGNCCGGEFFAGKAGFLPHKGAEVHRYMFLFLALGYFKAESGLLTRMSFLFVLITGRTEAQGTSKRPITHLLGYLNKTWCGAWLNMQCFFVL